MTGGPGHVPPEILADSAEELLPAAEEAAVRAHLDSCANCRQLAADLREVPVLLASQAPPRMPDDIAARLEATLRAEPPLPPAPAPHPSAPGPAVRFARTERRSRGLPVWIGPAAAAVLGVTGAVLGVRALEGNTVPTSGAGTALEADRAAEAPESALSTPAGGRAYTADNLNAQVLALVAQDEAGAPHEDAAGDGREAAPGTLPGSESTAAEPAAPPGDLSALATLATPKGLAACISSLTGREEVTPIAVDLASFEKQPAAVIVLPDPDNDELLDVRVVGPGCSATDHDLLAATSVPRP